MLANIVQVCDTSHIRYISPDEYNGGYRLIQEGEILFNRYKVERLLGEGAFGTVYLVQHINLKVLRALKCIRKSQDIYGTAMREADILKNLRHSAIPIIYDIEENNEYICIVEEYAKGMSLEDLISNNQRFTSGEIIRLGLELCEVGKYLHSKGVFHNDIKPGNIIISNSKMKLLDYGNSTCLENSSSTKLGTKGYAAPEMYRDTQLGAGSDVYSIGVVMLVMATGDKDADAIERVRSLELRSVISQCICHSETERIETINKLEKLLKKISRKKFQMENVPLRIGFTGAEPNCGVTHCAISAAYKLKKEGFSVVICERNDSGDFFEFIKNCDRVIFKRGIYRIDGIDFVPEYNECVTLDFLDQYDRVITDYGTLTEENLNEILGMDRICLVTLGVAYDIRKYFRLNPEIFMDKDKLCTIINLAGVKAYKMRVKDIRIVNPVRCGYNPIN